MPLSTFTDILPILDKKQVCLPAFCPFGGQPDNVRGVIEAAEQAGAPVMFMIFEPTSDYLGYEAGIELIKFYSDRAKVPVVLHLDHGNSEELVERSLKCGMKSVMFDGSELPLDENIARTKEMVKLAHSYGASIEGEVGSFNAEGTEAEDKGEEDENDWTGLTTPEDAERFVKETGVDLFAPAVGNAHGFYKRAPKLRFGLIEEIQKRTGVALSLHGGSGIPLEDVNRAATLGFRKMNIATQLHHTFGKAIAETTDIPWADSPYDSWKKPLLNGRKAITEKALEYYQVLNCTGLI